MLAAAAIAAGALVAAPVAGAAVNDVPLPGSRLTAIGGTADVSATATRGSTLYLGGVFHGIGRRSPGLAVVDGGSGRLDETVDELVAVSGRQAGVTADAADGSGGAWIKTTNVPGSGPGGLVHVSTGGRLQPGTVAFRNGAASVAPTALARVGDRVFAVGGFDSADGQPRSGLAAFDAGSGALDAWRPPAISGGQVSGVVAAGADALLVTGTFTTVDGQPRAGLALLDRTSGALRDWQPAGAPRPTTGIAPAVDGDTAYVVAAGGDGNPSVWALGLADRSARDLRLGADGAIAAIAVADGKLLVAGGFAKIGAQATQPARAGLAEVDPADGQATAWDAHLARSSGGRVSVRSLLVDGTAVRFSGSFSTVAGRTRCTVAAVGRGDAVATDWDPRVSSEPATCEGGVDLLASGDRLWLTGEGLQAANVEPRHGLAAIDVADDRLLAWAPALDIWFGPSDEPLPTALAVAPDGSSVYVGAFGITAANGVPRSNLAALASADGGTAADQPTDVRDWDPAPDGAVNAIELSADGGIAILGGEFQTVGGQARAGLASLTTASAATVDPWAPNPDGPVTQLARGGDGTLYVAGGFANLGGQARNGLAAFAGATGAPTAFDPHGPAGASYNDIAVGPAPAGGDAVYVAFGSTEQRQIGGQARRAVAALRGDSGDATTWAPTIESGRTVDQVSVVGGSAYLLGSFRTIAGTGQGQQEPRSQIAAVDADGKLLPWAPQLTGTPAGWTRPRVLAVAGRLVVPTAGIQGVGGVGQNGFAVFGDAVAPVLSAAPTVGGVPRLDATVSCQPATYSAGEPLRRSYRWLRDGQPIGGATGTTYSVSADDVGTMLSCEETGANPAGSVATPSEPVRAISGPPANEEPPQVVGTVQVGLAATCTTGRWTNADGFDYRWLIDGAAIAGATTRSYVPADGQQGRQLGCEVTGRNAAGPGAPVRSAARGIEARPATTTTTTPTTTTTVPTTTSVPTTTVPTTTTPDGRPVKVTLGKLAATRKRLTVAVRAGGAGRLTLRLTTKVGKRTVTLGSGYVTVKRSGALSVRLKPSGKGRSALRKGRRLTVAVTASLTPPAGGPATTGTAKATRKVRVG
ncbi:hypothetical protein PAI11_12690 [Patulibacter medicamentivorans]|uniref:Ig-like domain-containing protein n=1 Tax=Patulibacter medicamentivorans TaxID=1097667 RepID=H0E3A1_9ACTN|nr:hypothetical protein [Patulibacter medicamentivorans]EHN11837.1 hypothetical protein PAI11_12690 [Patulibacter medicamentivorans]